MMNKVLAISSTRQMVLLLAGALSMHPDSMMAMRVSFSKGKNTYLILQENFIVLHPFNLLGEMDLAKKGCSLKKMVVMATLTVH